MYLGQYIIYGAGVGLDGAMGAEGRGGAYP